MFGVCRVKNGCGQSGDETLKLTLSENEQMEELVFYMLIHKNQKLIKRFFG